MSNLGIIRKPFRYRFYNATLVLIGLNVLVYIIGLFWFPFRGVPIPGTELYLGLRPQLVLEAGYVWQVLTYMFVHGSIFHIFFNMLCLFIFGTQLEKRMGSSEFLLLYFFTGIGTGLFSLLLGMNVVGASGAIYALLLAFAVYFPDARIVIWFIPMRAPIAVAVFTVLSLVFHFTGLLGGISHLGHLAGIVLSYLYFLVRIGINPIRHFLDRR
jgi:membrane associated rhomboid family serine protease